MLLSYSEDARSQSGLDMSSDVHGEPASMKQLWPMSRLYASTNAAESSALTRPPSSWRQSVTDRLLHMQRTCCACSPRGCRACRCFCLTHHSCMDDVTGAFVSPFSSSEPITTLLYLYSDELQYCRLLCPVISAAP